MTIRGSFTTFAALAQLPLLVRRQRRLERRLADVEVDVEKEKIVRKEIDALLVKAGLAKSEGVTCLGYDVVHNERAGQASLNEDKLIEQLVAAGVDRDFVVTAIAECTERGEPAKFATVKPSKGAKVRNT